MKSKQLLTPFRAMLLLVLACVVVWLVAHIMHTRAVEREYKYTATNGTVTIILYTGTSGNLTFPDKINGLPVTDIGSAFTHCFLEIGGKQFWAAYILTNVTIPDSVTNIEPVAFSDCRNLTKVTMSRNVRHIGAEAFFNCRSLTSIVIPDGVTSIEENTFAGCTNLTNIRIPNGVTEIGMEAFYHCRKLTKLDIPSSVTNIGYAASALATA